MKDIVESIIKTNYSEWHNVECLQDYVVKRKTNNITFRGNEKYKGSKINDNWWLIDCVGIPSEDFKKYFKDI